MCQTSLALTDLKPVLKLLNLNSKADPAQTPGYVLQVTQPNHLQKD